MVKIIVYVVYSVSNVNDTINIVIKKEILIAIDYLNVLRVPVKCGF